MKKFLCVLLIGIVVFTGIIMLFNINIITRQGVNYQWHTIGTPLYLKILDFFDRHYNYKELVRRIIKDAKTDKGQVMRIFEWTHKNIRKVPEGFPIIDDHVWHIIVRGYGTNDQSSDVFTALCNYAGIDAFYSWVYTKEQDSRIPLSFVKLNKKWSVFDPYNGVYFKNNIGGLASVEDIVKGDWIVDEIGQLSKSNLDYTNYLTNLPVIISRVEFRRANIQSPINRLVWEIKRWQLALSKQRNNDL
jgi:hypothetical protein